MFSSTQFSGHLLNNKLLIKIPKFFFGNFSEILIFSYCPPISTQHIFSLICQTSVYNLQETPWELLFFLRIYDYLDKKTLRMTRQWNHFLLKMLKLHSTTLYIYLWSILNPVLHFGDDFPSKTYLYICFIYHFYNSLNLSVQLWSYQLLDFQELLVMPEKVLNCSRRS